MGTTKHKRTRLLYLGDPMRPKDPWSEGNLTPPPHFEIEFVPLLDTHQYSDTLQYAPIKIILLDLDMIAHTKPLDHWAVNAWRATFNDLVARLTSNVDGTSPKFVGITRSKSWEIAHLGVQLGARELSDITNLSDCLSGVLGEVTTQPEVSTPDKASDVAILKFPTTQLTASAKEGNSQTPSQKFPDFISIPRHTIPFPIEGLDGTSHAIEGVKELIRRAAPIDTSILIIGPTGSGKELVARSIHKHSSRFSQPFVTLHCASLNPNLIESELFGHTKGAFTDATQDRTGLLIQANKGTLFLDEISALSLDVQTRLLRVLSDRKVTPVGSSDSLELDLRVISATQLNPQELVEQGKLREDFLFRLRVIEISLPSLSERKSDIPAIALSFIRKLAKKHKRPVPELSNEVVEKFLLYRWPGNIRELENVLEHASTLCWAEDRTDLRVNDLPESVRFASMKSGLEHELKEAVKRFEKEYIAATVRRLGGSKEEAAQVLGLSLATLYRKLGS